MAYPPRPVRPLPGAPAEDTDEGARTGLVTRIIILGTIVLGQLWALTGALEAYLLGETSHAWGLAGFSGTSFAVVLLLVHLDPAARAGRNRPGRR
jgi:hypothetical protein